MDTAAQRPITIAILAMGGEGGGVLAEWIVDVAEHAGYIAQMTSVPGVAQRTGATNYYVELFPKHGAKANSPAPKQPAIMPARFYTITHPSAREPPVEAMPLKI